MGLWRKGMVWSCFLMCTLCLFGQTMQQIQPPAVAVAQLVSWGTSGDLVRRTQERLSELGYYRGTPDGIFGSQTYEAILGFQQASGLKADGVAGEATLRALGIPLENTPGKSGGGSVAEYDEEDVLTLGAIIHGEARGEPYEGQVAVGAVVLNRVESPDFPDSIEEVIYQRGAFDAVSDGQFYLTPNETALQAARDALNGWDPVNDALYYWNPTTATSRWIWSIPITASIGRHVFGKK